MDFLTPTQRANAGIAYMDENVPEWAKYINLQTFDLSSGAYCVMGQMRRHNITMPWDIDFVAINLGLLGTKLDYLLMEPIWRSAIKARQEEMACQSIV